MAEGADGAFTIINNLFNVINIIKNSYNSVSGKIACESLDLLFFWG
jgi:hypothetical protein